MGSGASKNPTVGLPMSPRVEFAEKNAPKGAQPLLIDTPALIDLGHGTVRYRVGQGDERKPEPKKAKAGYFYHPRLDDYSEEASEQPEDTFKYNYVYKAPLKARGKKLFYVYGIGMNSMDQAKMVKKPYYRPKGKGYLWPSSFRKSNHVYYEITFVEQEADLLDSDSDGEDIADESEEKITDNIRFNLKEDDTVEKLKKRISVRLLVPVLNVHLSHRETELSNDDIVGKLRTMDEGSFKRFTIELQAV
ncbi:uncharacterized protein [Ptychodera flava]|uniref:uncharacterized protein n=1 Tax=Ptychodera flava TaxID=63121 RepID=UPI003969CA6B